MTQPRVVAHRGGMTDLRNTSNVAGREFWLGQDLRITILTTAEETEGRHDLVEGVKQPGQTTPLHLHRRYEERIWVVSGELEVWAGDQHAVLRSGDFVHVPLNVPHALRAGDDGCRSLNISSPAGQVGLATVLDREAAVSYDARRRALLLECRSYIETHLADFELGPTQVAGAHHISLRYLHRLFEATESGVAEYFRRRRLDRCRRDLLDPALAGRPVAAVGARWAFLDPAHFSRVFKAEYGLPPAAYRAKHAPQHALSTR